MEDRIRHCGRCADDSDFSEAFYAEGADLVVLFVCEDNLDVLDIGMGRKPSA